MDIIYYKDPIGNFGDDLNIWMWDLICPSIKNLDSEYSLLGVGSILQKEMIKNNKIIVFGSGFGCGSIPDVDKLKIIAVRGKLTAKLLNIDESLAISDSAILLNLIHEFAPIKESERNGIIFIPHHHTIKTGNWEEICKLANVELVSPSTDSKYVINKIRKAKLIITESMHGAIIADAMRVRWIPVVMSDDIFTFKWLDWLSMFNINYNPIYIGLSDLHKYRLDKLKIDCNICLYKPNHFKMNINELLRKDYPSYLINIKYRIKRFFIKQLKYSITEAQQLKHMNKIVKKIKNLKQSQSYLSDDKIFYERLSSLKMKLHEIEKIS